MTILDSNQTWDLWQQGKKAWNAAIQSGRITEVTFVGDLPSDQYQFQDCHFPAKTYFHNVRFISTGNEPSISFENADFKQVEFIHVNFESEFTSFKDAKFNGKATFRDITFKGASFENSKFHELLVFKRTTFSGRALFGDARFYKEADFSNNIFKKEAIFEKIESKGGINFTGAKFNGLAYFVKANFHQETNFGMATFSDISKFDQAMFGDNNLFINAKFLDHASFDMIEAPEAQLFSFKSASLDSIFSISSEEKIGCVIDFVDTQAKYTLYLGDISCVFHREHRYLKNHKWLSCIFKCLLCGFQVAKDIHDISRLRKLKKIAQEEKDHLRALDYRVQEMQAKRWHDNPTEKTWLLSKLLKATPEFIFWLFSNYGRSIARPIDWLLLLTLIMATAYYCLAPINATTDCPAKQGSCLSEQVDYWDALGYSASQIFPWVPIARKDKLLEAKNNSSVTVISPYIKILSFIQTLFGTFFLFLLGLGARNRFLL